MPGPVSDSYEGPADPRPGAVLTCAFCGQAYPDGTPATKHERLTAHVKVCPSHPMRDVERGRDQFMDLLAELRPAQKDSFRTRRDAALRASKTRERRVDEALTDRRQPSLFGEA